MQDQQKKQRQMLAIAAMLACLSVFLIQQYAKRQWMVEMAQAEAMLTEKQSLALAMFEVQRAGQHADALQQFQQRALQYQRATNEILAMLSASPKKAVCLSGITRVKSDITFSGYALSAADLMAELNRWRAADLFQAVTLVHVQQDNNRTVRFQARVTELKVWSMQS